MTLQRITPAVVQWSDDGSPTSQTFNDVYFSKSGGSDETDYVFLQQNRLHSRFEALNPGQKFTIAETGFGTGLNFLCLWRLWNQLAPKDALLTFFSVDLYPLTKEDLIKALEQWPEFDTYAEQLIEAYPDLAPGYHCLEFGNVRLILSYSDASWAFSEFKGKVDAFFLDGFAPAKNPGMWTPELFQHIARIAKINATFATFTAAAVVRNGLKGVGFQVEKCKGFGRKRDMLRGQFRGLGPCLPENRNNWFQFSPTQTSESKSKKTVAVIGAGISGCLTAMSLRRRGFSVTVFEKGSIAQAGSGNRQGALYVKLASQLTHHCRFYAQAFIHASRQYQILKKAGAEWHPCGVLQTAWNEDEQKRQQQFLKQSAFPDHMVKGVCAEEASNLAGININDSALYFPKGGWANPESLCREALIGIDIQENTEVTQLKWNSEKKHWALETSNEQHFFETVVIACAYQSQTFQQLADIPVKSIRGQVSHQPLKEQPNLKTVLSSHVYVSPPWNEQLVFGATFHQGDMDESVRQSDHEENIQLLGKSFPSLMPYLKSKELSGRTGFRCTSPDYTPLVGPVPVWESLKKSYQGWGQYKNRLWPKVENQPNLYCNLGHGSRGLASAPLCAEYLASVINGEPLPLPWDLAEHLHPARFAIRELKKKS